jgi:hypothetical protein
VRGASPHVPRVPRRNDFMAANMASGAGCACNRRLLHKSHALLTTIVSADTSTRDWQKSERERERERVMERVLALFPRSIPVIHVLVLSH